MTAMMTAYNKNSASHIYYFGFVVASLLYVMTGMTFDELSAYFKADRASSKRGGFAKIRIKAKVAECAELLPRAICLGDEQILEDEKWNTGIKFEKVVTEQVALQEWARDSVPFWMAPDIDLDGRKIQVKFNGAELTNEKVFQNNFPELLPR